MTLVTRALEIVPKISAATAQVLKQIPTRGGDVGVANHHPTEISPAAVPRVFRILPELEPRFSSPPPPTVPTIIAGPMCHLIAPYALCCTCRREQPWEYVVKHRFSVGSMVNLGTLNQALWRTEPAKYPRQLLPMVQLDGQQELDLPLRRREIPEHDISVVFRQLRNRRHCLGA